MTRNYLYFFIFIIGTGLSVGWLWFYDNYLVATSKKNNNITIVCTTSMIADAVKEIADNKHLNLLCLMGPGIDPHLYQATEGDVIKFSSADIIFYQGLHLEGKMVDILKTMKKYTASYAVADGIAKEQLIPSEFDNIYDPHVWHDVALWIQVVQYICDCLCKHDVINETTYRKKTKQYIRKLGSLDKYVKEKIKGLTKKNKKILVTAHDAFSYFGKRYNLEVVALQGMSTDAQINTKEIKTLAAFIVEHKVKALFVESTVPHKYVHAVQCAVQGMDWQVALGADLYSDALGKKDSDAANYISMIQHNVNAIVFGLS